MTAEILIMNKSAIAMAADSAVTVGSLKTYNGVNKLFMLSNNPPMGIMIYGNADFIHMPFETLIKEYRAKKENEGYKTVHSAMENFLKFITKYGKTKADPNEYFNMQIKHFEEGINKELEEIKEENMVEILETIVDGISDENLKLISNTKQFKGKKEIFEKLTKKYFLKNKDDHEKINLLLKKVFYKHLLVNSTGIVIAGFNEEDIYPSFSSFRVLTMLDEKLIFIKLEEDKNQYIPRIIPFAQRDVVDAFLAGLNLEIAEDLNQFFEKTIEDYPKKIMSALTENTKIKKNQLNIVRKEMKKITKENKRIIKKFEKMIQQSVNESYGPILQSIGALPKEELGNMCESLIHITSLKRKVSDGLESVGGEIDVAIISKGDGFIWAKRKHYFNPEMNQQFFERKK